MRMNDKTRKNHRWIPEGLSAEETEAAKQARREYYRDRYRQNPERQRQANLRYWARRAAAKNGSQSGEVTTDGR